MNVAAMKRERALLELELSKVWREYLRVFNVLAGINLAIKIITE